MMKNVRSLMVVVALSTGTLGALGCGGSVEQPQTQASVATKAPIAPSSHGVVKVFGAALGEVALRPDQRTELEKLAVAADARHASMLAGKKDLMLAVADQIEKGALDKAALQSKLDRIVADVEKGRPEDHAALARMHAILDSEQRNAFVDALEQQFKKGKHGAHGEHGEHGERVAQGAQGEQGARAMHGMHGLKQLADDLKLTDDQRSQIRDALAGARAGHGKDGALLRERMEHGKKTLESFRSDTFDPNAAAPSPEALRAQVTSGSTRFLTIAEKVLPILTVEQRTIAAGKLRELADAGAELPFAH